MDFFLLVGLNTYSNILKLVIIVKFVINTVYLNNKQLINLEYVIRRLFLFKFLLFLLNASSLLRIDKTK